VRIAGFGGATQARIKGGNKGSTAGEIRDEPSGDFSARRAVGRVSPRAPVFSGHGHEEGEARFALVLVIFYPFFFFPPAPCSFMPRPHVAGGGKELCAHAAGEHPVRCLEIMRFRPAVRADHDRPSTGSAADLGQGPGTTAVTWRTVGN